MISREGAKGAETVDDAWQAQGFVALHSVARGTLPPLRLGVRFSSACKGISTGSRATAMQVRGRCCVLLIATVVAGVVGGRCAFAQVCVGDCNEDHVVRPVEVSDCIATAFGLQGLALCPPCDGGDDGGVTVDDLVKAVRDSLLDCAVSPGEAGDAGASGSLTGGALIGTSGGILDIGFLSSGGGASLGDAADGVPLVPLASIVGPRSAPAGGAASTFVPCALGGAVTFSCSATEDEARLDSIYIDCSFFDEATGNVLHYDGDQIVVAADPQLCQTLRVTTGRPVTSSSISLQFTASTTDGDAFRSEQRSNLTTMLDRVGPGCQLNRASMQADGQVELSCLGQLPGSSYECGASGVQSTELVFGDYSLVVDAEGSPGSACSDVLTANGRLESPPANFGALYERFEERITQLPGLGTQTRLDGMQTLSCLVRPLATETVEALVTPTGAPCPNAGVLRLSDAAADRTSVVRFTPNGVVVDFDGDGMGDHFFSSCQDPLLARCFAASPPPTPTPSGPSGLVCSPCDDAVACDRRLTCSACIDNCQSGASTRCAPDDFAVECADGLYGPLAF